MSHTVQCKIAVTDKDALAQAAKNCGYEFWQEGQHKLFDGTYQGCAVQIPGWRYPVVANTETGELKYDDYNGSWGKVADLDYLLQEYSAVTMEMQAALQGYSCQREYDAQTNDLTLTVSC